jgi:restriction system protein
MKNRTINQSIIEVLKREGIPLFPKEIYNKIIEYDFYRFRAEFPENIVRIQLRRHCINLSFPTASPTKYFQMLEDKKYWLKDEQIPGTNKTIKRTKWKFNRTIEELNKLHSNLKEEFKQEIIEQIKALDPYSFEVFSKNLLEVYGFSNMEVTKKTSDGGIDGFGKLKVGISLLNVAFQSKKWKHNVNRVEIDKFRGATQGDFEQGIFFTTSKFSKGAKDASIKKGAIPIVLIDGETIVEIMIEKNFGVQKEELPIYINAIDDIFSE